MGVHKTYEYTAHTAQN